MTIIFYLLFIFIQPVFGQEKEADQKPTILEEVVVEGKRLTPLPGKVTVSGSDLKHVPGTAGDAIRALQSLPGVGVANDFNGLLYIRGGAPEDNVFYYDRAYLFYPYHFGGLVSTLNSEVIRRVDIYAGGFGAEFGADSQAVIDIESRDGRQDRVGAKININIPIMSDAIFEGPIGHGKRGSWYLAGRRSYIDLFPIKIKRLTAIPRFWDYQSKLSYTLNSNGRLTAQAYGAGDFMGIRLNKEDVSRDPDLAGDFHYRSGFNSQSLTWQSKLSEKIESFVTFAHTPYLFDVKVGSGKNFLRVAPDFYSLRTDLSYVLTPIHRLETGLAAATGIVKIKSFFPRPPSEGEINYRFSEQEKVESNTRDRYNLLEWYLQHKFTPIKLITLSLGFRMDYFNRTDQISFEPRASLSLRFLDDSEIRLAWGKYLQSPLPYQISLPWGNPEIFDSEAVHYVFDIHRRFGAKIDAKLAFYHKALSNLITPDPSRIYLNQGEGFARGMELFIRHKPSERFSGWLSYAYSISKRRDRPKAPERFYSFDQTHVISLIASYFISPSFEVGAKWHYSTGTPYTPVVGAVTNPDDYSDYSDPRFKPLFGDINSKRLPPFHRLDLRLDKQFNFRTWKLGAYLEILNAYDHKNVLAIDYNQDYSQEKRLYQLPIIPILGVNMEF